MTVANEERDKIFMEFSFSFMVLCFPLTMGKFQVFSLFLSILFYSTEVLPRIDILFPQLILPCFTIRFFVFFLHFLFFPLLAGWVGPWGTLPFLAQRRRRYGLGRHERKKNKKTKKAKFGEAEKGGEFLIYFRST